MGPSDAASLLNAVYPRKSEIFVQICPNFVSVKHYGLEHRCERPRQCRLARPKEPITRIFTGDHLRFLLIRNGRFTSRKCKSKNCFATRTAYLWTAWRAACDPDTLFCSDSRPLNCTDAMQRSDASLLGLPPKTNVIRGPLLKWRLTLDEGRDPNVNRRSTDRSISF
jgi:hypothetical protein